MVDYCCLPPHCAIYSHWYKPFVSPLTPCPDPLPGMTVARTPTLAVPDRKERDLADWGLDCCQQTHWWPRHCLGQEGHLSNLVAHAFPYAILTTGPFSWENW